MQTLDGQPLGLGTSQPAPVLSGPGWPRKDKYKRLCRAAAPEPKNTRTDIRNNHRCSLYCTTLIFMCHTFCINFFFFLMFGLAIKCLRLCLVPTNFTHQLRLHPFCEVCFIMCQKTVNYQTLLSSNVTPRYWPCVTFSDNTQDTKVALVSGICMQGLELLT